jgi:hypothetical protein
MLDTMDKKDVLGFEKFVLDELAINTVSTMMGFTATDLLNEKHKENPDMKKIREIEEALDVMYSQRQEIYSGNDEIKRSVIECYSPVIRERLENGG